MDLKRNAQIGTTGMKNSKSAMTKANGRPGAKKGGSEDMGIDGDISDANLNIIQFLMAQPKKKEELKFQRVVTS